MSLDQLMLWRFRNIEGVLDNSQSWNMVECKFEDGSTITYDYTNSMVTIDSKKKMLRLTILFTKLIRIHFFNIC